VAAFRERVLAGPRKAGMPEEWSRTRLRRSTSTAPRVFLFRARNWMTA